MTTKGVLLVDPGTGATHDSSHASCSLDGKTLPVPFSTFAPNIIEASTGSSPADRNTIVILAQVAGNDPKNAAVLVYHVGQLQVEVIDIISTPPLGPCCSEA